MSNPSRPFGLSAFIRCKNEEEFIVASLLSVLRFVDEAVVVLNNSKDGTRALVEELAEKQPNIRLLDYPYECAVVGPSYAETIKRDAMASLAAYYNWCTERTRYSHVCKWDGDMIALPAMSAVRNAMVLSDLVLFDGVDAVGEATTTMEPRVFRYDPRKAAYVDWDLYEVLDHEYSSIIRIDEPCYLHLKLVKREYRNRPFGNINEFATSSAPPPRGPRPTVGRRLRSLARSALARIRT